MHIFIKSAYFCIKLHFLVIAVVKSLQVFLCKKLESLAEIYDHLKPISPKHISTKKAETHGAKKFKNSEIGACVKQKL